MQYSVLPPSLREGDRRLAVEGVLMLCYTTKPIFFLTLESVFLAQ